MEHDRQHQELLVQGQDPHQQDPALLQERVQRHRSVQQELVPAGQQPVRHGEGGEGSVLPVHEDHWAGAHAKEDVGEGEAAEELQPGAAEDRRGADILAVLFAAQEQAEVHQDLPVPDQGEEAHVEKAEEAGDCEPQEGPNWRAQGEEGARGG